MSSSSFAPPFFFHSPVIVDSLEQWVRQLFPQSILEQYDWALKQGHPQSSQFPLMNPFHVFLIAVGYLLSVFIGKAVMRNSQKKFDLKAFSFLHNSILILLSAYMCVECLRQAILNRFSLWGNGVDPTPTGVPLAHVLWIFYFSKTIEFIDTWIMILKKNFRQITFLHVFHHVSIFGIWWAVVFYAPGGDAYFSATQNSFVHICMYGHYLLASMGFKAWWKNYITMLQMTQFLFNLLQAAYDMVFDTAYPKFLATILFYYMIVLLLLFLNFFVQDRARLAEERKQKKAQ